LSSAEDANRSIENLHKTELHGRVISVEPVSIYNLFLLRLKKFIFLIDFIKQAKRDNGYQQTAKSSDASKVNVNSEADRKNKKPEEKKEKREKRPEITINDVEKKPDVSRDRKRSC